MQILVNTDNQILGDQRLTEVVEGVVEDSVEHFRDHLTRVEVHLNDVNSQKSGANDKRCMMEARVEGHSPVAVTHEAESLMLAMEGAADKLKAALESLLGRLHRR